MTLTPKDEAPTVDDGSGDDLGGGELDEDLDWTVNLDMVEEYHNSLDEMEADFDELPPVEDAPAATPPTVPEP